MDSYTGGLIAILGVFLLVCLAIAVLGIVANWKLFEKAGEPGWSAIIPFYNSYQMAKIATGDTKICWAYIIVSIANTVVGDLPQLISGSEESGGGALAFILSIASLVLGSYICYMFAKSFGQSTAMCVLSIFFGGIIFIILAFNKNVEYVGPKGEPRFGGYNSYDSYNY